MEPAVDCNSASNANFGHDSGMQVLLDVVQRLSLIRTRGEIQSIVGQAARTMAKADGACFVLRDGDCCYYVDEDAVAPLWKGKRFPMSSCISGWAMLNRSSVAIADIRKDSRVPMDAYRTTFVRSLAMVPIRQMMPIGALGIYWANEHHATAQEVALLEALANTTAVALENLELFEQLSTRLRDLDRAKNELGRFVWLSSHDLREPLRMISTHSELMERSGDLAVNSRAYHSLQRVRAGVNRLDELTRAVVDYLNLELRLHDSLPIPTNEIVANVIEATKHLRTHPDDRVSTLRLPMVRVDGELLSRVLCNLVSNASKFRKPGLPLHVEIFGDEDAACWRLMVRDNGLGIASSDQTRIFGFFERLHSQDQYPGSGLGLAFCRKVVEAWNGQLQVDSQLGEGSTFAISIPKSAGAVVANEDPAFLHR